MDPNATLAEIRTLVDAQQAGAAIDGARLAELVLALDEWITGGGFLPIAWSGNR